MSKPRYFSRDLAIKLGVFTTACVVKAATGMDGGHLAGLAAVAYPVINTSADWVANLSANLSASSADASAAECKAWNDLFHNEDLATAIGQALHKRLEIVSDQWGDNRPAVLDRLTAGIAEHWSALSTADALFLQPLADDRLTEQLTGWLHRAEGSPLTAAEWQAFIGSMLTDEERQDGVAVYVIEKLGPILAEFIMHDLVEVIAADFKDGGKIYAKVSLRFFTELTAGVEGISKRIEFLLTRNEGWSDYLSSQVEAIRSELRELRETRHASTAPPFQLPPAASEYFGRAALVADLAARLRKGERTDVWGGPGIGKTALTAAAVATIIGDDPAALAASPFPHGIVFLDLYLHKELGTAWQALANAFDANLPTDMLALDRAAAACAKRRALIILEGAEELGARLDEFLKVTAAESTLLVLTREETQTAAARRLRLDDLLEDPDALALLRHLAGDAIPPSILEAVQARLGGHPLALTWAGNQLADATQPAAHFFRDLSAAPFTSSPNRAAIRSTPSGGCSTAGVRLMSAATRVVLAAVARISEPFDAAWAVVADGSEDDLQRLVQLSFLRVNQDPPAWQFAHALAAQYARALPLPEGLLAALGTAPSPGSKPLMPDATRKAPARSVSPSPTPPPCLVTMQRPARSASSRMRLFSMIAITTPSASVAVGSTSPAAPLSRSASGRSVLRRKKRQCPTGNGKAP